MNIAVSIVICLLVLVLGLMFALFPRRGLRLISRCASSYLKEDLSSDPAHVLAIRFYGVAAVLLGLYALYQVIGAMAP